MSNQFILQASISIPRSKWFIVHVSIAWWYKYYPNQASLYRAFMIFRTTDLIQMLKSKVEKDRRMSICQLANDAGLSKSTAHPISTTDLHLKSSCSVWTPTLLTEKNKKNKIKCFKLSSCQTWQIEVIVEILNI